MSLSHEDDDVIVSKRVIEEDHDIVLEGLEELASNILFPPASFFALAILCIRNLAQGCNTYCFVLLEFPHEEHSMREGFKVIDRWAIPCP